MNHTPHHITASNFIPVTKEYFLEVSAPHLAATRTLTKPTTRHYTIVGKVVTIHWYGAPLYTSTAAALNHHPIVTREDSENSDSPSPSSDLVIHAWDDSITGASPIAPWHHETFSREFDPNASFYGVYVSGEESLSMYDPTTKTGYFWTHDALRLPGWVPSAPFRTILHWFFSESAAHLLHGAVIGSNNQSVLLTAKGGSGKSTTALSCLLAGMDYLADDYIAVTLNGGNLPLAHSLFQSAKITEHGMQFFPELREKIWNTDFETREDKREKALFFLQDIFPGQIKNQSTLSAIFIPKITGGITRIVPATKMEALLAIAPTSLLQLPLAETTKLQAFKEIINNIPCYTLELGPNVREVPQTIYEFFSKHHSSRL